MSIPEKVRLVAVMFKENVASGKPTYMEVDRYEWHSLTGATKDKRFIKLEGKYHNLDEIVAFWDEEEVPDDDIG